MEQPTETRPPNHRANSIKSSLHIMEFSQAEPIKKVIACLQGLYPEDVEQIEKAIVQTLNHLDKKQ